MPLAHRSDASRWQASRAESSGPNAGISDSGSVVTAITRPAPMRITALSQPTPGPSSTSSRRAPSCRAIVRSNSAGVILPSGVVMGA